MSAHLDEKQTSSAAASSASDANGAAGKTDMQIINDIETDWRWGSVCLFFEHFLPLFPGSIQFKPEQLLRSFLCQSHDACEKHDTSKWSECMCYSEACQHYRALIAQLLQLLEPQRPNSKKATDRMSVNGVNLLLALQQFFDIYYHMADQQEIRKQLKLLENSCGVEPMKRALQLRKEESKEAEEAEDDEEEEYDSYTLLTFHLHSFEPVGKLHLMHFISEIVVSELDAIHEACSNSHAASDKTSSFALPSTTFANLSLPHGSDDDGANFWCFVENESGRIHLYKDTVFDAAPPTPQQPVAASQPITTTGRSPVPPPPPPPPPPPIPAPPPTLGSNQSTTTPVRPLNPPTPLGAARPAGPIPLTPASTSHIPKVIPKLFTPKPLTPKPLNAPKPLTPSSNSSSSTIPKLFAKTPTPLASGPRPLLPAGSSKPTPTPLNAKTQKRKLDEKSFAVSSSRKDKDVKSKVKRSDSEKSKKDKKAKKEKKKKDKKKKKEKKSKKKKKQRREISSSSSEESASESSSEEEEEAEEPQPMSPATPSESSAPSESEPEESEAEEEEEQEGEEVAEDESDAESSNSSPTNANDDSDMEDEEENADEEAEDAEMEEEKQEESKPNQVADEEEFLNDDDEESVIVPMRDPPAPRFCFSLLAYDFQAVEDWVKVGLLTQTKQSSLDFLNRLSKEVLPNAMLIQKKAERDRRRNSTREAAAARAAFYHEAGFTDYSAQRSQRATRKSVNYKEMEENAEMFQEETAAPESDSEPVAAVAPVGRTTRNSRAAVSPMVEPEEDQPTLKSVWDLPAAEPVAASAAVETAAAAGTSSLDQADAVATAPPAEQSELAPANLAPVAASSAAEAM